MEMSELIAYASEKYQIREERKWADFPRFSVLCHPQTGKWVALLMRQWDTETGEEIERCDIKCGSGALGRLSKPYLAPPLRMRGGKWISVAFDHRTESGVVRTLFDAAIRQNAPHGYTLVLGSQLPSNEGTYKETALPFLRVKGKSGCFMQVQDHIQAVSPAAGDSPLQMAVPGFPRRGVLILQQVVIHREADMIRAPGADHSEIFFPDKIPVPLFGIITLGEPSAQIDPFLKTFPDFHKAYPFTLPAVTPLMIDLDSRM